MAKPTILFVFLVLICTLGVSSFYASSVNISRTTFQADYGTLTYVYFETSSGPGSSTPGTNTALIPSLGSGSYAVSRGSSAYLWSAPFAQAATVSAGTWVLDLWAAGSSSGVMKVSIYVTNSGGTVQSTIASSVATSTIGSTETQVVLRFSGVQVSVPASGYIEVELYAPSGSGNPRSFTIYWGAAQQTDLQVPYSVLSA